MGQLVFATIHSLATFFRQRLPAEVAQADAQPERLHLVIWSTDLVRDGPSRRGNLCSAILTTGCAIHQTFPFLPPTGSGDTITFFAGLISPTEEPHAPGIRVVGPEREEHRFLPRFLPVFKRLSIKERGPGKEIRIPFTTNLGQRSMQGAAELAAIQALAIKPLPHVSFMT